MTNTRRIDSLEQKREALVATIRTHERRLHALAVRILGDHHAAEDAVQDAYARAWRSLDRFRGEASMATWLHRITSNTCIDVLRRHTPVLLDGTDEETSASLDEDIADTVTARTVVWDALASLPEMQRDALVLTGIVGLDYAEASAALGVPEGTVASRLNRARRSMRERLDVAA